MENEMLELRARMLDEMTEQTGALGIPDLEKFVEVSRKLKPYKCPQCYKIVYSNEEYVLRSGIRTHKKCNEIIENRAKEARQIWKEQKERSNQIKHEIEHNLRETTSFISLTVTGLKKDIEKFESNVGNLAKEYGLQPWERVIK